MSTTTEATTLPAWNLTAASSEAVVVSTAATDSLVSGAVLATDSSTGAVTSVLSDLSRLSEFPNACSLIGEVSLLDTSIASAKTVAKSRMDALETCSGVVSTLAEIIRARVAELTEGEFPSCIVPSGEGLGWPAGGPIVEACHACASALVGVGSALDSLKFKLSLCGQHTRVLADVAEKLAVATTITSMEATLNCPIQLADDIEKTLAHDLAQAAMQFSAIASAETACTAPALADACRHCSTETVRPPLSMPDLSATP